MYWYSNQINKWAAPQYLFDSFVANSINPLPSPLLHKTVLTAFCRGGLRFKLELQSFLFVPAGMLLKRLERYGGARPFIAL